MRVAVKLYNGDLHFHEAAFFNTDFRHVCDGVTTAEFKNIAKAYEENLERIICLGSAPMKMLYWTAQLERARVSINIDRGVDPLLATPMRNPEFRDKLKSWFGSSLLKFVDDWSSNHVQ